MRKRHFLVCILVLIMAFLLVGCSGNNEPAAEIDNKTADNTAAEENSDQDQAALKASVEGNVENPYEFMLSDFKGQEVTIEAEMKKECCDKTEAAKKYTGVPISAILNKAKPNEDSTKLTVTSADGYQKNFVMEYVLQDDSLILSEQEGSLQVIAGDTEKYDGSYWISDVVKLTVN
ncbi:MAG: molybdopterin-dependent oxidoreductase [Thermacetogeniaceae bacterium]|nr:molybdopterin-dependent oxidoreductase [Thermoanaerobacterales bacterium]NLN21521.1 molybdopterin-dependent oxidoreductase [Syntrophomonadaceae bacterium]